MRLTVFGATGRTGRFVVAQGLQRGNEITAFVRDASASQVSDRMTVVEGDARETVAVERALAGAEAVVSVLALADAEDEPAFSDATRVVVDAAKREGIRQIVVTANNHVFGDAEVSGEFAAHAREHRRNRDVVRSSGLRWTIGAAPWVVDDAGVGSYQTVIDAPGPGRKLTTQDFATFILDALERDDWVGHIVGVTN